MDKKTKLIIIALIIVFIGVILAFAFTAMSRDQEPVENAGTTVSVTPSVDEQLREELEKKAEESETEYDVKNITNILFIGVDNANLSSMDAQGNADGVILVSVNTDTEEIVLTSFVRDTRVRVKDSYYNKLTMVYHEGGVELLRETFEANYEIPVDNYILVNYLDVVEIVDAVGGLTIELSAEEIRAMESKIHNVTWLVGDEPGSHAISVDQADTPLLLDGVQVASYLRIRPSDGFYDFGRTDRAREVILGILAKAQSMGISDLMKFADTFFPAIETDMSGTDMMAFLSRAGEIMGYEKISDRIPIDGAYEHSNDGNSMIIPDFEVNNKHLYESIYEGKH